MGKYLQVVSDGSSGLYGCPSTISEALFPSIGFSANEACFLHVDDLRYSNLKTTIFLQIQPVLTIVDLLMPTYCHRIGFKSRVHPLDASFDHFPALLTEKPSMAIRTRVYYAGDFCGMFPRSSCPGRSHFMLWQMKACLYTICPAYLQIARRSVHRLAQEERRIE